MILDGFVPFNFNEGVPYVSVTNNGVTFNKSVVMKLDYPRFVQLLINASTQQIAILPCDETALNAVAFFKPKKKNVISVRWNGRDLLNTLQDLTGWDLSKQAFKIEGEFIKDANIVLFDMTKAVSLN
ncbi:MAG: hypothetical protein E7544_05950 [Ruminococcaceae bacterium]|nr:hypothetical protein [Oscillospiraceae bacterium]